MPTRTGPGAVVERRDPAALNALLYNYDIDGDEPKAEHLAWLSVAARSQLVARPLSRAWIVGRTSRTGEEAHNLRLSERRAARVADFIAGFRIDNSQVCRTSDRQVLALGESLSVGVSDEDARDRAVFVSIVPVLSYRPSAAPPTPRPRPRPEPRGPALGQSFSIRMTYGSSVGDVVCWDQAVFEIRDETHGMVATYMMEGLSACIGLPASVTAVGPWNPFFVPRPLAVTQFGGYGSMNSLGIGPSSDAWLELPTPSGMRNVIIPHFRTGYTFGGGFSAFHGWVFLSAAPYPS